MVVYLFLLFIGGIMTIMTTLDASASKITPQTDMETFVQPLGLPPVPWPDDNPYSEKKAKLGRMLYFDLRLSTNHTVSCSTCHNIPCAYSDCRAIAIGIEKRSGTRHSPSIINAAYLKYLFWDGRASSLEAQCKGPIANYNEMANIDNVHEAYRQCQENIRRIPGYRALFKEVFGHDQITIEEIAKAIATFERTVLSGNSPYDRYRLQEKTAMSTEQIRGMELFHKVGCATCHGGVNFADNRFANIGIGMDKPNPDTGRYGVTHQDQDWGAFKIATLREVEHTGPYMHDGSLKTLEEVIDYYDKGGIPNKNLHPLMRPLHLTVEDKKALVSFLKALSGEGWQHFKEPKEYP